MRNIIEKAGSVSQDAEDRYKFIRSKLENDMEVHEVVRILTTAGWEHQIAIDAVRDVAHELKELRDSDPGSKAEVLGHAHTDSRSHKSRKKLRISKPTFTMHVRLASVGLWLTTIFVSWFIAAILGLIDEANVQGLSWQIVLTVIFSLGAVPLFVVADRKVREELLIYKEKADDYSLERFIRSGRFAALVLAILTGVITLFIFVSAAVIADSDVDILTGIQSLVFTAGFSVAFLYYHLFGLSNKLKQGK